MSAANNPLGQQISAPALYDPSILFAIERQINRSTLQLPQTWYGADIWNAYEVSWLNKKGKPIVAIATFCFPHNSSYLIESKSLKLYLNSFNQEKLLDQNEFIHRTKTDLSSCAGAEVDVTLTGMKNDVEIMGIQALDGINLDSLDIEIDTYEPKPSLLRCLPKAPLISETVTSDLLKSNCPVTGQPDWGSVQIRYTGPSIDHASLLAYIVSMRNHTEFHEHCVEKIFADILKACQPHELTVYARYTRRGGLDINPWRSTHPVSVSNYRTPRQ